MAEILEKYPIHQNFSSYVEQNIELRGKTRYVNFIKLSDAFEVRNSGSAVIGWPLALIS